MSVIDEFHIAYYNSLVWMGPTKWLGVPVQKLPLDLWLYQEIIVEIKPDLIIECGTCWGGGALYLSSICDLVGKGRVISIDNAPQPNLPIHPRLTYLTGSSTSPKIFQKVQGSISPGKTVLVILDSNHKRDHVLQELRLYSQIVTKGSYLIVEDTNINGHPVKPDFGPGPMEALDEFLQQNKQFVIDENKHKFLLTFFPRGFLRKVR